MSFEDDEEKRKQAIEAINPLSAINNMNAMHQTELVDFFSQQGALKISEYISAHPNRGTMIAKLFSQAAAQGSSQIHMPVDPTTSKGQILIDLTSPAAPLQISALVAQHPGQTENILDKIANAGATSNKFHFAPTSEII